MANLWLGSVVGAYYLVAPGLIGFAGLIALLFLWNEFESKFSWIVAGAVLVGCIPTSLAIYSLFGTGYMFLVIPPTVIGFIYLARFAIHRVRRASEK
jgi:hypothetical protein